MSINKLNECIKRGLENLDEILPGIKAIAEKRNKQWFIRRVGFINPTCLINARYFIEKAVETESEELIKKLLSDASTSIGVFLQTSSFIPAFYQDKIRKLQNDLCDLINAL